MLRLRPRIPLVLLACAACGRIGLDDYVAADVADAAIDATTGDASAVLDATMSDATSIDAAATIDATISSSDDASEAGAAPDAIADVASIDAADASLDASDAAVDASDASAVDAADAAESGPPPIVYNDVTNASYWSTFDVGSITGATVFTGAAFDGRYVYFGPGYGGGPEVARYDTQGSFTSASSWAMFNVGTSSYGGVIYDGKYVYFMPYGASYLERYDPSMPFANASSWTSVANSVTGLANIEGANFDGRYLYAATDQIGRYDTTAAVTSGSSWTSFNPGQLSPSAADLECGCGDGRYMYFIPDDQYGTPARYDTTAPFASTSSWASVDLLNWSGTYHGFAGCVFDGRYIYVPSWAQNLALRYDTTASFTAQTSWTEYDTPASVQTSAFDGRYVYFGGESSGTTVRYDTTAPYTSATSWSTYDAGVTSINGLVFDGHYMYFTAAGGTVMARFLAVSLSSPAPVLPGLKGTY